MAMTTILAAGTTNATSSDVVVAVGSTVNIGMFRTSGTIPGSYQMQLVMVTPGVDLLIATLDANNPATQVGGPGTYRVIRNASSDSVGAFSQA